MEGKSVVDRGEAVRRIKAAADARDEMQRSMGMDIVILARTDARVESLDEAIHRCKLFMEAGYTLMTPTAP